MQLFGYRRTNGLALVNLFLFTPFMDCLWCFQWDIQSVSECSSDSNHSDNSISFSLFLVLVRYCLWSNCILEWKCQSRVQPCCPQGLALASRILKDTSWRSWPWPRKL